MENPKIQVNLIARFIPIYCLIHTGLTKEKNVTWPSVMTKLIRKLASGSDAILFALINQRKKTNGGKPSVMTEEEKILFSNPNASGVNTGLKPHNIRPRYDFVSESDQYKQKKLRFILYVTVISV